MLSDACANFGFLSIGSECPSERCRQEIIALRPGLVSDYGDVIGPEGLTCLECGDEYEQATCEDFGENSEKYCPEGYLIYPVVHKDKEISANQKMCLGRLVCFTCNSPYIPLNPPEIPY